MATRILIEVDGKTVEVAMEKDGMTFPEFMEQLAGPAIAAHWSEELMNRWRGK